MKTYGFVITLVLSALFCGCATAPEKPESRDVLDAQVKEAIAAFREQDPSIGRFFEQSAGYAVVPKVFKGAFLLGGAYGRGQVYENGSLVGYCSLSQATLGFSFGGEFFREIIFFRDSIDFSTFKTGEFTFSAQATAVAIDAGAAAKADYKSGMAVFIMAEKGLMIDASIGGQKFKYRPR